MRITVKISLLIINAICFNGIAWENVEIEQCRKQIDKVFLPEVNCIIHFGSISESEMKSNTNGFFKSYTCNIPVKFQKSEIYGSWIKSDSISFPKLKLNCIINSATGEVLEASAKAKPSCKRNKETWLCEINMSDTEGLGVLGRIIENNINNDKRIKDKLGESLGKLVKNNQTRN